jgi:hypothetical protein
MFVRELRRSRQAERVRQLVLDVLKASDPNVYVDQLLDDARLSVEEVYAFAHIVRHIASAKAKNLVNDHERDLRCSFCLRTRDVATAIVRGLDANICDRCIDGAVYTVKG